jgi:hypothetical protein
VAPPLAIFDDVSRVSFRLPGQAPQEIADGIGTLMDDIAAGAARVGQVQAEAERWRASHRYSHLGERLYNMLAALRSAQDWQRRMGGQASFPPRQG